MPAVCWIGPKHAAPGFEFPAIDQLLQFSILGVFSAADKMGKTLPGEPWFTSGQTEGNVWIIAPNHSGYSSVLGIVTKARQHTSSLVLIALVLIFATNLVFFAK